MTLLEHDLDVGPGLVDPVAERDDGVVGRDHDEPHDDDEQPDREQRQPSRTASREPARQRERSATAEPMARVAPSSPSRNRCSLRPTASVGEPAATMSRTSGVVVSTS